MNSDDQIRLRLRFYKDVPQSIDSICKKFLDYKESKPDDCSIKIKHDHVWINVVETKKEYWSPHLHLEFEKTSDNETHIRGLFGPEPTLWTFFMFLHFMVAGIFIVFCGIAYSDYTLKRPTTLDFAVILLMIIVWFLLYFIARQIRHRGNGQMNELEKIFLKIIA